MKSLKRDHPALNCYHALASSSLQPETKHQWSDSNGRIPFEADTFANVRIKGH